MTLLAMWAKKVLDLHFYLKVTMKMHHANIVYFSFYARTLLVFCAQDHHHLKGEGLQYNTEVVPTTQKYFNRAVADLGKSFYGNCGNCNDDADDNEDDNNSYYYLLL